MRELAMWGRFYDEKNREQQEAQRKANRRRGRSTSDFTVDPERLSDDDVMRLF